MRLRILALLVGLLAIAAQGHIIDSEGNCIAGCHVVDDDDVLLPDAVAGANHAVVNTTDQELYECGVVNTTYTTHNRVVLCLFFDQMDPVQKVVFAPKVDSFEALQIKGLYDKFAPSFNGTEAVRMSMTAMVSGVRSPPSVFKQDN